MMVPVSLHSWGSGPQWGGVNQCGAQTTPDAQLTARLARLWTVTGHGVDMYHVGCAGAQVALPVEG
jgi:hypothetical protein